jgi:inosine-uridine nucleoside N-ribohydrolase
MKSWALAAVFALAAPLSAAPVRRPIPIVVDTDIGTDIDDAFALALVMKCPELHLLGVTTVSGDAVARARLAAKFLAVAGGRWARIPVYAGASSAPQPLGQARWAAGFSGPTFHSSGAVRFLRETIERHPGKVTVVAIAQLTNIADLLQGDPAIARDIPRIALMGGAIAMGYGGPGSAPQPEWNIRSDIAAAQVVFASGIPLIVAPLDLGPAEKLDRSQCERIYARDGAVGAALRSLVAIWRPQVYALYHQEDPMLWDPMAVAMLVDPGICRSKLLAVRVDAKGMTRVVPGLPPNARVGLSAEAATFDRFLLGRVAP